MVTTSDTSSHQCKVKLNRKFSAALRKMGKKSLYPDQSFIWFNGKVLSSNISGPLIAD